MMQPDQLRKPSNRERPGTSILSFVGQEPVLENPCGTFHILIRAPDILPTVMESYVGSGLDSSPSPRGRGAGVRVGLFDTKYH
jgi:hypothetical protein